MTLTRNQRLARAALVLAVFVIALSFITAKGIAASVDAPACYDGATAPVAQPDRAPVS